MLRGNHSYLPESECSLGYPMDSKQLRDSLRGSRFGLPTNIPQPVKFSSTTPGSDKSDFTPAAHLYVDPDTITNQRVSAISSVESQAAMAKSQALADFEAQKAAIDMRYEHELSIAEAAIEQSRQRALFALEQQHQQRKLEIEQRSQEQRLQIDAAASEMIMQAHQQKLQKEMTDRFVKLNMNPSGASSYFGGTSRSFGIDSPGGVKAHTPRVQTTKMNGFSAQNQA